MYGAPAWQSWLSATRLEQLEPCQNRAHRVITGQLQTTPVETLRRDARGSSMATLVRRQTAIAYEKATRLTPEDPRRRLLNSAAFGRQKPDKGAATNINLKGTPPRPT